MSQELWDEAPGLNSPGVHARRWACWGLEGGKTGTQREAQELQPMLVAGSAAGVLQQGLAKARWTTGRLAAVATPCPAF
jgi:hypothetical protein